MQTDKYVYNAWGKVVSSSGSTVNPYKYVGQLGYYSDSGTGLMLLSSRFYNPEAGVFTQRDEAKDGLSFYAYTSGQVMTAVDPWGKVPTYTLPDAKECVTRYKSCYDSAQSQLLKCTAKLYRPRSIIYGVTAIGFTLGILGMISPIGAGIIVIAGVVSFIGNEIVSQQNGSVSKEALSSCVCAYDSCIYGVNKRKIKENNGYAVIGFTPSDACKDANKRAPRPEVLPEDLPA